MDWSNEKWLKLYTRDSLTWLGWSWQARAVFCFLLRKVDRSGIIDCGQLSAAQGVSMLTGVPEDVCATAIHELMKSETISFSRNKLVIPKFLAAQEARQSDKLRQSESRGRRLIKAIQGTEITNVVSHGVTPSHTASHDVTTRLDETRLEERARAKKIVSDKPKPSPEHQTTIDRLVKSFEESCGSRYAFMGGRDATAVKGLLSIADGDEIDRRWRLALKHKGFPEVRTIGQLHQHWNQFVAGPRESPPSRRL